MTPPVDDERDWFQYRRLILSELQRIGDAVSNVDAKIDRVRSEEISQLKVDVAMLQVRAGMWGSLGGAILGAIVAALITKVLGAS